MFPGEGGSAVPSSSYILASPCPRASAADLAACQVAEHWQLSASQLELPLPAARSGSDNGDSSPVRLPNSLSASS